MEVFDGDGVRLSVAGIVTVKPENKSLTFQGAAFFRY
jgi:hypothetical protein